MSDAYSWNEISLHSICNVTKEPSLVSFDYDENDSFMKSLSTLEILPSLEYILSDQNDLNATANSRTQPKNVWGNTGPTRFKPSLFSKCLAAKVKSDKYKQLKLLQVNKKLRLDEPHSWYSAYLLVAIATRKVSQFAKL